MFCKSNLFLGSAFNPNPTRLKSKSETYRYRCSSDACTKGFEYMQYNMWGLRGVRIFAFSCTAADGTHKNVDCSPFVPIVVMPFFSPIADQTSHTSTSSSVSNVTRRERGPCQRGKSRNEFFSLFMRDWNLPRKGIWTRSGLLVYTNWSDMATTGNNGC